MDDNRKMSPLPVLEVAVIGGGPAGIIAAKELIQLCNFKVLNPDAAQNGHESSTKNGEPQGYIAIFEETGSAGGVWTMDPERQRQSVPCICEDLDPCEDSDNKQDKNLKTEISVATSTQPIYEYLQANLFKDLSSFKDHPFPPEVPLFPSPRQVASYYQEYAKLHGLAPDGIHYHTRVTKCWKQPEDGGMWTVQVESTSESNGHSTKIFKSKRVLVCTGHHRKAFVPNIRGLRHFEGELKHSSAFGSPKEYHDKSVLIVGGGISGADIAIVLAKHGTCKRIVVSVRQWNVFYKMMFRSLQKSHSVVVRRGIDCIAEGPTVHFNDKADGDGHENGGCEDQECPPLKPDVIIFATGYRYWYPFLPSTGKFLSSPSGYKMNRLYMRLLCIDDPTLAFIGVTNVNLSPAIMLEYQSRWYAKLVVKEQRTFDVAEMEREAAVHDSDGTQDRLLFKFPSYCNSLARMTGDWGYWTQILCLRLPWHIRSLWTLRKRVSLLCWGAILLAGPCVCVAVCVSSCTKS